MLDGPDIMMILMGDDVFENRLPIFLPSIDRDDDIADARGERRDAHIQMSQVVLIEYTFCRWIHGK